MSPATATHPGPEEVSGLSAVNEEVTSLRHREMAFAPLPVNYQLWPHEQPTPRPEGTGRMRSHMRQELDGWTGVHHTRVLLVLWKTDASQ